MEALHCTVWIEPLANQKQNILLYHKTTHYVAMFSYLL